MIYNWLYFPLTMGVISLLFAFYRLLWIRKQDPGNERLQEIGADIRRGAMAFMRREYQVLFFLLLVGSALLVIGERGAGRFTAVSFITGAVMSGLAGFLGMNAATLANTRTAHSAETSLVKALKVAFTGGSVMGLSVVGLAIIGLSGLMLIFTRLFPAPEQLNELVLPIISGYSMGASSVALFARVGGGIFTKAADVGADLVGKVEAGIPEDDPRNPATIADNVGDNVGDVAGLGSDLCESYIGTVIGAMVLGGVLSVKSGQFSLVLLPLLLAGLGIFISILGTLLVKMKGEGNPQQALNLGTIGAAVMMVAVSYPLIRYFVPVPVEVDGFSYTPWGLFVCLVLGLAAGVLVGVITEYYTADEKKPVMEIAEASSTGAATNIIAGVQVGMRSTGLPIVMIAAGIAGAYFTGHLFGISLAALGMLATTGIQLSVDAYGPVADNAGGLAEMSGADHRVRERTDKLDAVGNTTAAIGKGFAIGSAALTALSLFVAYKEKVGLTQIDATKATVIIGLLFGGMLPYFFSSLVIGSVGRAAFKMIGEVRRQFQEIPGILEGTEKPDYVRCVDIATKAAIKEMVPPGVIAIAVPVLVGFLGGPEILGGVLVGVTISGVMLAIFMGNSGGAWDNAKKHIEQGAYGGKGSEAHKASVIGDTVGDPFKDTAGPSMDILIKLMSVVALVIAPMIAG